MQKMKKNQIYPKTECQKLTPYHTTIRVLKNLQEGNCYPGYRAKTASDLRLDRFILIPVYKQKQAIFLFVPRRFYGIFRLMRELI